MCATPIGNLGDISLRLETTLGSVSLIAAEDTRVTQVLLSKLGLKVPMLSLQKFNEGDRVSKILEVLNSGKNVALVSDAGTPNIADPGAYLVDQVRQAGFRVSPVPGPSALTAFLSVSGVLANPFFFAGFLPKKRSELESLVAQSPIAVPFVFYETGSRLLTRLTELGRLRSISKLVVAKELTKWYETVWSGSYNQILEDLSTTSLKGEWVGLLLWQDTTDSPVSETVSQLKSMGLTSRQILEVATGLLKYSKNAVYDEIHHD